MSDNNATILKLDSSNVHNNNEHLKETINIFKLTDAYKHKYSYGNDHTQFYNEVSARLDVIDTNEVLCAKVKDVQIKKYQYQIIRL